MKTLIELLRVRQWVKNFFLIFPLVFSGKFTQFDLWVNCIIAIAGFSFVSSGMYILNDIIDFKNDQLHPKKALRPLASGKVKRHTAFIIAFVCLAIGLFVCNVVHHDLFLLAVAYILLHTLYNLRTKHVVILDVLTVAFGFQMRIWAGAIAVSIVPSLWLQMCVFILALFLGFTKRRYEVMTLKTEATAHRDVLSQYSIYLLDQIISICSTLSIVFYGLYAISSEVVSRIGGYEMFYSIAFVIYGIFRYLYLLHVKKAGDDPSEVLLSDWPLIINIILWVGFVMMVIILG